MTGKELILATMEFRNTTGRVPMTLGYLPWAEMYHADKLEHIKKSFKWDTGGVNPKFARPTKAWGDAYEIGEFTDDWGCMFHNIQRGVHGEVKEPLVKDDDWADVDNIHIPEELLSFEIEDVNAQCAAQSDLFIGSHTVGRPFEQLQFIRGTENLLMDLMDPPKAMLEFMEKMYDFYVRVCKKWAQTDVDAIFFMDDWGAQNDLLIPPALWDEYFAPFYRTFIDIAHSHGKKALMHTDGHTLRIIPKLIDMGLDAINAQLFCMDMNELSRYRGKITFWGEIDRQYLIPYGTPEEIDAAVKSVYDNLWQDGGCVAQCEFGPGANPDNVYRIYDQWRALGARPIAAAE